MNSTHNITFCLKETMEKEKMSKNKLCKLTGLRFETIQGYFSRVDLYVLSLLCEALHCDIHGIIKLKN